VFLVHGARTGTGDHLIYNYATDEVTSLRTRLAGNHPGSSEQFVEKYHRAHWTATGGKISAVMNREIVTRKF
jgi:hypothetical protein